MKKFSRKWIIRESLVRGYRNRFRKEKLSKGQFQSWNMLLSSWLQRMKLGINFQMNWSERFLINQGIIYGMDIFQMKFMKKNYIK